MFVITFKDPRVRGEDNFLLGVIPAQAGIHCIVTKIDSGMHRNDKKRRLRDLRALRGSQNKQPRINADEHKYSHVIANAVQECFRRKGSLTLMSAESIPAQAGIHYLLTVYPDFRQDAKRIFEIHKSPHDPFGFNLPCL